MKTIRLLILVLLAFAPALHAAPVTWTSSSVSGPSDVITTGTLIGAMNVGGSSSQSVNGVNFASDPGGTAAIDLGPVGRPTMRPSTNRRSTTLEMQ